MRPKNIFGVGENEGCLVRGQLGDTCMCGRGAGIAPSKRSLPSIRHDTMAECYTWSIIIDLMAELDISSQ